jgi:hypothetical protein
VASIATVEQTQVWSPNVARPTRVVRAVYEAPDDRATIWTAPNPGCNVRGAMATEPTAARDALDSKRPSVSRRSLDPRQALRTRASVHRQRCPASRTKAELASAERDRSTRKA